MAPEAVDGALLMSMVTAVQKVAIETGLNEVGFVIKAYAIASGTTPHMHWHVMSMEENK